MKQIDESMFDQAYDPHGKAAYCLKVIKKIQANEPDTKNPSTPTTSVTAAPPT